MKNLQTAVLFLVGLATDLDKAFEDGQFQLTETSLFFDDVVKIPQVMAALPLVPAEWNSSTNKEKEELFTYLNKQLDLSNDRLEKVVEIALELGMSVYLTVLKGFDLAQAVKELNNQSPLQ